MDARDIMTKDVITFTPGMTIGEAQSALLRYRIHGAPVVDDTKRMIGMVSLTDLSAGFGERISDVMTPDPVSADGSTPVEQLAGLMLDRMVRRIAILDEGRVVGIVSASDIIRALLDLHEERRPAAGSR
jgi:CBS domain-containing protein